MIRTVATAGLTLALGAFALAWLDLQQATHRMTGQEMTLLGVLASGHASRARRQEFRAEKARASRDDRRSWVFR